MDLISNFAMPVVCKNKKLLEKYKKRFSSNDVEIRPVIAGNMVRQPFYKKYLKGVISVVIYKSCQIIYLLYLDPNLFRIFIFVQGSIFILLNQINHSQTIVGKSIIWLNTNNLLKDLDGFFVILQLSIHPSQSIMRIYIFRILFNRLFKSINGFLIFSQFSISPAQVIINISVIRINPNKLPGKLLQFSHNFLFIKKPT